MSASRHTRRLLRYGVNLFYRPYVLNRIKRTEVLSIEGFRIETHPSVFHPSLFQSTELLVAHIKGLCLKGKKVLDMGTGTGVIAMTAASQGSQPTAVDANPAAVELCRKNVSANSADVEIIESDLFSKLEGRQFDLIFFNVPFYPKPAGGGLSSAFNAGNDFDVISRFAHDLPSHLCDAGSAVIIFSEDSGFEKITGFFEQAGLAVQQTIRKTAIFEHYFIVTFRKKSTTKDQFYRQ